jgi:hypothetical protein
VTGEGSFRKVSYGNFYGHLLEEALCRHIRHRSLAWQAATAPTAVCGLPPGDKAMPTGAVVPSLQGPCAPVRQELHVPCTQCVGRIRDLRPAFRCPPLPDCPCHGGQRTCLLEAANTHARRVGQRARRRQAMSSTGTRRVHTLRDTEATWPCHGDRPTKQTGAAGPHRCRGCRAVCPSHVRPGLPWPGRCASNKEQESPTDRSVCWTQALCVQWPCPARDTAPGIVEDTAEAGDPSFGGSPCNKRTVPRFGLARLPARMVEVGWAGSLAP